MAKVRECSTPKSDKGVSLFIQQNLSEFRNVTDIQFIFPHVMIWKQGNTTVVVLYEVGQSVVKKQSKGLSLIVKAIEDLLLLFPPD